MTKSNFNYKTIQLARESRGKSQLELAEETKIPQSDLSKYENGIYDISEDALQKIADTLDYPISFFYQDIRLYPSNLHFRKKSNVTSRIVSMAEANMNIYRSQIDLLLKSGSIPYTKLPEFDFTAKRETQKSAIYLRHYWNITKGRIDDLTKIIEDHGIIVILIDFKSDKIDGRSMRTSDGHHIIFINKDLPGDRYRLTLAHELAHILLHLHHPDFDIDNVETEAMDFAREFLMPESEIRSQLVGKIDMQKLADLKAYWKVSMQAILLWAQRLKIVTANQNRYLNSQFYSLNIKEVEPIEIPVERPTLLQEVLTGYYKELGYTKDDLLKVLHMKIEDFESKYEPPAKSAFKVIR